MSVDAAKLKKGDRIRLKDATVLTVSGAYMSTDGLIITAKPSDQGIYARNCKPEDIVEVVPKG